jgi:hypothetical protein
MLNIEFLQFLDLKEICKLAMTCFRLYSIIDENRFICDENKHSCHLKLIASTQLLNVQIKSQVQIDSIFKIDIKFITDFQYLNGSCYKDVLISQLAMPPKTELYQMIFDQEPDSDSEEEDDDLNED